MSSRAATPSAPTAITNAAQAIYDTTAQLEGAAQSGGESLTSCTFSYGTNPDALDQTAPCAQTPPVDGASTAVSATLSGLEPGLTYYDELHAVNGVGSAAGGVSSFTTSFADPPAPTGTDPVTVPAIDDTNAIVSATVDPGAGIVSCTVDYGTSTAYGSQASCATPATGGGSQTVTALATGLTGGTGYHAQLVLKTAGGTWTSADITFTTLAAVVGPPGAVSSTTAALTGTVNPEGQTVVACAFVYAVYRGAFQAVPCDQSPASLSGTQSLPVTATAAGLLPRTGYGYFVYLQTSVGTALGGVGLLTTTAPPVAHATPATSVTATTAVLHGSVDSSGAPITGCTFVYQPSAFGSRGGVGVTLSAPCTPSPGTDDSRVTLRVRGLAADTTYYARVVLTTPGATATSAAVRIRTARPPRSRPHR